MEEAFTFNSYQLENIIKRPSSTDHQPHIRKRIIHSKISKKQYLYLNPNIADDVQPSTNDVNATPKKKVRFNLENNSVFQPNNTQSNKPLARKSRSLHQNQIIETINQVNQKNNLSRFPFKQINNKPKMIDLGKKSLSIVNNTGKQPKLKSQQKITKYRQQKILSLKVNPKIVLISQRKLPKAFKNNYLINLNQLKLEVPKIELQELLKQQKQIEYNKLSSQNLNKLKGISRLQKNLEIQQKIFNKLHGPTKPY